MRLKVLIRFNDLKAKTIREVGDEFVADQTRLDEILNAHRQPLVEVIEEKKKPAPKKAAKK